MPPRTTRRRSNRWWPLALFASSLFINPAWAEKAGLTDCPADQELNWKVVAERSTPAENFIQGFEIHDGRWWLSSGGYGHSHVDLLDSTGEVAARSRLSSGLFAEGLTIRGDEIWLLSWRSGLGFRLDKNSLAVTSQFTYQGEGWGLAWDAERKQFLMSNGSGTLAWRRPDNFQTVAELPVRRGMRRVTRLNELELVGTQIYANIWLEDEILRIDRDTGCVNGHLDLRPLWPAAKRPRNADVLNGIAYDPNTGWLWVTGKLWGRAFALRISESPAPTAAP